MLDLDDSDSGSDSSLGGAALDSGDIGDAEGDALDIFKEDAALLGCGEDALSGIDGLFETELQTGQKREPIKVEENKKRRKLKNLPTFASVDDYVEMLEEDEVL
jgi:ribosome biogenesis protein MAK21